MKNKNYKIGVFISDEGYGHSVRQKTLINEFLKNYPNIKFTIFNNKRLSFLKEYFGNKLDYVSYPNTLYTVKKKNGELDLKKTKKVLISWSKNSSLNIYKLLKKKNNLDFNFIISDLVPEAFELAKILKIPSFGVARFAWDWFFYNTEFKNLDAVKSITRKLRLSKKIYFPTFVKKKIMASYYSSTKETNLIFNKNMFKENTFQFAKSNNKFRCLIMDNGTKTNSELIKKTIKYLKNIKKIDFYLSIDNYSDELKSYVAEQKNLIPVSGLKNMHRLIEYVDFLVARGGFNTLTEILVLKKPTLLIDEKNNPEIEQNLKQMKKLGYAATMKQSSFVNNFEKRINFFIKYQMQNIKKKLKLKKFKSNGANEIMKDIIYNYEKS